MFLGSKTSPLYQLAEDFWRWRLEDSPELATTVGVHDYNDRLETFTRDAFRKRKVSQRNLQTLPIHDMPP